MNNDDDFWEKYERYLIKEMKFGKDGSINTYKWLYYRNKTNKWH